MLNKLTKKQEALMATKRDEWIDISIHTTGIDKEEAEAGIKWLYYASNLKEPKVVFVKSPKDFAKKFRASVRASVRDSVRDSVGASVGASVRASVWDSVRASVRASVSWTSLTYDSDFASWAEYYKEIGIVENENLDKYLGFLRSGAFYTFLFEKVAYVMQRPDAVYQDEQKRLHSTEHPAIQWADGTGIYSINGVAFDKKLWEKVVGDKLTPEQVFAIENTEQRRVAYELMDKLKMKKLKNYEVLDHRDADEQGNMDEIVQFEVKGFDDPFIYYHCECPSTGRRYYIQTEEKTCAAAKAKSFGMDEVNWIAEY